MREDYKAVCVCTEDGDELALLTVRAVKGAVWSDHVQLDAFDSLGQLYIVLGSATLRWLVSDLFNTAHSRITVGRFTTISFVS